jgi:hypothetical protein
MPRGIGKLRRQGNKGRFVVGRRMNRAKTLAPGRFRACVKSSAQNPARVRTHDKADRDRRPLSQGDHETYFCQLDSNRRVDRAGLCQHAVQSTRHSVAEFHTDSFRVTDERITSGLPTYTANLCSIHSGGAASHSRRRITILHSEGEDCKRLL